MTERHAALDRIARAIDQHTLGLLAPELREIAAFLRDAADDLDYLAEQRDRPPDSDALDNDDTQT